MLFGWLYILGIMHQAQSPVWYGSEHSIFYRFSPVSTFYRFNYNLYFALCKQIEIQLFELCYDDPWYFVFLFS